MNTIRVAIAVCRFNPEITSGLLKGARQVLREHNIADDAIETVDIPGAFEAPLAAKLLAESKKYDGVICLGAVIKGDTAHFEFISLGATIGLQQAMLMTNIPIAMGIITTYTDEQATARSLDNPHNKGREAALACLEMIAFRKNNPVF